MSRPTLGGRRSLRASGRQIWEGHKSHLHGRVAGCSTMWPWPYCTHHSRIAGCSLVGGSVQDLGGADEAYTDPET